MIKNFFKTLTSISLILVILVILFNGTYYRVSLGFNLTPEGQEAILRALTSDSGSFGAVGGGHGNKERLELEIHSN